MLPHYLWKIKVQICDNLHTRWTFSRSVMVSVGISKLGLTDLMFVDPEVKINGGYYCDILLSQQLLLVVCDVSGDFFIFQQDSAPAHQARENVRFLEHPLSFLQICGCQIAATSLRSIARPIWWVTSSSECISRSCTALTNWRKRLLDVWHDIMDQSVIDDAFDEWWCKRLQTCVRVKGGHFEQLLEPWQ